MRPVSQAKVTLGHRFFTKNLSAAGRRPANDGPKGKTAPVGSAIRPWDAGGLHAAVQLLENRSVFQKPKKAKKKKKKKNKTKIIIMTKKKKPGRPAPEADLRSAGPRAGPAAQRMVQERKNFFRKKRAWSAAALPPAGPWASKEHGQQDTGFGGQTPRSRSYRHNTEVRQEWTWG